MSVTLDTLIDVKMDEDSLLFSEEATKTVDVHIKLSSLKIEEIHSKSEAEPKQTSNVYRMSSAAPYVNLKGISEAICDWRELVRCISVILRFFLIVKLICMSVFHFRIDRVQEQL